MEESMNATPRVRPKLSWRKKLLFTVILLAAALVLGELAGQAWFLWWQQPAWEALKQDPNFYYLPSKDPVLGNILAADYEVNRPGRRLRITRGLRADEDVRQRAVDVLLLGDSVVFGTGLSQEETIPARLQTELNSGQPPAITVVNGGVPGYGLEELVALNRQLQGVLKPKLTLLVLNPNDFARRNTRYEGADNGLYRMFHPPTLLLPWVFDKAIYRWHKGGQYASLGWYEWLFAGTSRELLPLLGIIKRECEQQDGKLILVLYPAATAYGTAGAYGLNQQETTIARYAAAVGIPTWRAAQHFGPPTTAWSDDTDHLTAAGAKEFARWLAPQVKSAREWP